MNTTGKFPVSLFVGLFLGPLLAPVPLKGQPLLIETQRTSKIQISEVSDAPQAVVITVHGKCEYSDDGTTFMALKEEHVFKQGAVVRTGADARTDIFFRRVGTTVRLQPDSEMKLEKMERHLKNGQPVMDTLLALTKGRIFTAVRSFVPGSTFEVRNAAGRSVIEGGGEKGRYIITADGSQVADKNSDIPLKLIGEKGVTVITPGQTFSAKEGKMLPQDPKESVVSMLEFDELHAIAEKGNRLEAKK